ncbi:MarR family transcriptional regulator [Patescibacteria group bacterium]|nr:MarR family transcriptional regulator [Patescibacteria group bacterium]
MVRDTFKLIEQIFSVSRLLRDTMSDSDDFTRLTIQQIRALTYLRAVKKAIMSDVAAHFCIELPSATSLINRLCEQNLAVRREDALDRRLVVVSLTDRGRKLTEQVRRNRKKKLERVLSYLSEDDRKHLSSVLETLLRKLQS